MKKITIIVMFFIALVLSIFEGINGASDKAIIKMQVGNKSAYVDGILKTLDVAPNIIEGRALVPIRFVSEGLGATVGWDGTTKAITITMDSVSFLKSQIAQLEKENTNLTSESNSLKTEISQLEDELKKYQVASATEQVVEMHITYAGYVPDVLNIKKDIPVKWIIYGDQVSSCTNTIIVPSLNISKSIASGQNIINFTPKTTGTIDFSCGMGMIRGKFIVK